MNLICPVCLANGVDPKDAMYVAQFDENKIANTKCPRCQTPVTLPEKCCGQCIHSAQLMRDDNLICCVNSSLEALNAVPFNADASGCKLHCKLEDLEDADGELGEDLDEIEDDEDESTEPTTETSDEENEFDKAMDEID